jgi:predicted Zn finger-like uncharacterized protein
LFTQCPKCETVFKLSAEVLRAAGGQVRCGRCGEIFNALARLAEDASAFPAGESPLEMETRADEILHSVSEAHAPAAAQQPEDLDSTDAQFARLQVIDLDLYDDDRPSPPAPQPTVTAPRADSAAAVPTPAALSPPPATPPARPSAAPTEPATPAEPATLAQPDSDDTQESSLEFTLPPGELDRIFVESRPRPAQSVPAASGAEAKKTPQSNSPSAETSRRRLDGLEVSDEVRREMLSEFKPPPLPEIAPPHKRSLPAGVWLGAAIALALLLGLQIIHANREWLAAKGIGVGLPAPANLSAYQLRQWGVTGDPGAKGSLRVRASILNIAAQLQPYPLLRVTLANRFGSRIGTREFEPAEYLGKPTVRMLAPGERVDATLDILDPGKDAEGFEIDVCLRRADRKVTCAGDAASQTKP